MISLKLIDTWEWWWVFPLWPLLLDDALKVALLASTGVAARHLANCKLFVHASSDVIPTPSDLILKWWNFLFHIVIKSLLTNDIDIKEVFNRTQNFASFLECRVAVAKSPPAEMRMVLFTKKLWSHIWFWTTQKFSQADIWHFHAWTVIFLVNLIFTKHVFDLDNWVLLSFNIDMIDARNIEFIKLVLNRLMNKPTVLLDIDFSNNTKAILVKLSAIYSFCGFGYCCSLNIKINQIFRDFNRRLFQNLLVLFRN